jgi:uncharacterized membrane protein
MAVKDFFSESQKQDISRSIELAELNTSGEIRVHLENTCKTEPVKRAIEVFEKLAMHQTEQRNGVLFYLAVKDKKFAIIGDQGINDLVGNDFWEEVKTEMGNQFKLSQFSIGLCKGIEMAGEKLKFHFPYQANDVNELSNDISFGE